MKTCLVTGGAGFIGSHLVESLLKDYKVVCIDNLSTGSENNIKDFFGNNNFEFMKHDTKEPLNIKDSVDYIFHLASRASPIDFPEHPVDILMSNSLGLYNILNLAKEKKARFLFASSSEVYGEPLQHPQNESYWGNVNSVGIRSCYDEGKRFGEALVMSFYRKYNLDVRIARIFNTYGPRMRKDDGRVIPNFVTQALSNKPITVYGSGKQTRSFCYVYDMIECLKKLMFTANINEKIFNIGNDNSEINVLEVAKMIKELAKSNSNIVFKPLPKDDPTRRKPDITKSRELLGWEPKVNFEEGLAKTIDWFKGM